MQRDIGNELIVAIAAVAVLAFAIVFGIVLSLSSSSDSLRVTQTVTTAESNVAALDTAVLATDDVELSETATATETAFVADETEQQAAEISTERLSPTPKVTQTQTPKPTTIRPTREAPEITAVSTDRATAIPIATDTEVSTLAASASSEPSETTAPTATRTPAPQETERPIVTEADQPTQTPEPPSISAVATVGEGTLVFAQPTRVTGRQATATPRATIGVVLGTPARGICPMPQGWLAYSVGEGETLYAIARAVGVSIDDLLAANCLITPDVVTTGSTIFVPRAPVVMLLPGETVMPGVLFVEGCTLPNVQITRPVIGVALDGIVEVRGTAALDENFGEYRVEIFREDATEVITIVQASQPVVDDLLVSLDTDVFEDGVYWIRLVVVDQDETVRLTCAIPTLFN